MAYFDGIKVGDKVYGHDGQSWNVNHVDPVGDPNFLVVRENGLFWRVNGDGYISGYPSLGQQFFWQPVKIEVPPRPKRKIHKIATGSNIFWGFTEVWHPMGHLDGIRWDELKDKPPMTMTLEWEEEE
jgi:hypothetical protein